MATIVQTKEGTWRAQVRRKGKYASHTFRLKTEASLWARDTEHLIDQGGEPTTAQAHHAKTIGNLIDLHIADLQDVGKPLRRSKRTVLDALKRDLGSVSFRHFNRSLLIQYEKLRANAGAGPVTLAVDFSYLKAILTDAAAIDDIRVDTECVRLARTALTHLSLIGKSQERDRRPSASKIDELLEFFESKTNRHPHVSYHPLRHRYCHASGRNLQNPLG